MSPHAFMLPVAFYATLPVAAREQLHATWRMLAFYVGQGARV